MSKKKEDFEKNDEPRKAKFSRRDIELKKSHKADQSIKTKKKVRVGVTICESVHGNNCCREN